MSIPSFFLFPSLASRLHRKNQQSMIPIQTMLNVDTASVVQIPVVYFGDSFDLKATLARTPPIPPPMIHVAEATALFE